MTMELHPYHRTIIEANEAAGRPYFHQLSPVDARELLRAGIAAAPPALDLPELKAVENTSIEGPAGPIPLRIYMPEGAVIGTCVFFHAGGWIIGDLDLCDATCRRLAGWASCRIVSVDYRTAPEHPFPQPLEDCWAALKWADRQYPGSLIVAGESAGGNLAAVCALRARDAGSPDLAGQLLAYPVVDHDFETASYREVGTRNWLLSTADMRWFWDHYCPDRLDRNDPEISPLRIETTAGLAPAMILVGELDPLRDEGLAYARRLAEGGVPVTTRFDASMVHGYLAAAGSVPIAKVALSDATRWIRTCLEAEVANQSIGDDDGAVLDRFYGALSTGDLEAALDCLTPDARIWHCFDGIAQDRDESLAAWQALIAAFPERAFVDAKRHAIEGGYVQQHVMKGRRTSGDWIAWPICLVVKVRGDRIARIDEYIDRAGAFDLTTIKAATSP
jgi:acetyl esterase